MEVVGGLLSALSPSKTRAIEIPSPPAARHSEHGNISTSTSVSTASSPVQLPLRSGSAPNLTDTEQQALIKEEKERRDKEVEIVLTIGKPLEEVVIPLNATSDVISRPKILPPKSEAEMSRHLKEYERVAKHSRETMEREAKEKAKNDQAQKLREKKISEQLKVWQDDIIPKWEQKKKKKKTIALYWQGIPPSVRGKVWGLTLGNELRINRDLYEISQGHALKAKQALYQEQLNHNMSNIQISNSPKKDKLEHSSSSSRKHIETKNDRSHSTREQLENEVGYESDTSEDVLGKESSVQLIHLDLPANFPAIDLYNKKGPMHQSLVDVLEAYVCYRPDVGFVPEMSYLAATFLLYMESYEAFIALANLLNQPFYMALFRFDMTVIARYMNAMSGLIEAFLPRVYKNLTSLSIMPEIFLTDWLMTMYTKAMPLDIATRIWDITLIEGEMFLFRVTLAILRMYANILSVGSFEEGMALLKNLPKEMKEDDFFAFINEFPFDPKKWHVLVNTNK
eukprot:TRINITY_DN5237_c0_g2_i1.p1 TRINITY_DN5237_c0_g2~~TRINITY_DN5237_c0_g2_i1.p1  ORF type:complete len:510 (-),score=76.20 TRINITY_DN5237_c0_g2_i1:36-1565(-)